MSRSAEHDPTSRIVEELDDANDILRRFRSRPTPPDLDQLVDHSLRTAAGRQDQRDPGS